MSPDQLFHYTTAAGLLGIVQGAELWASDVNFLNDAQDAVYARDEVVQALLDMPNPAMDARRWNVAPGESTLQEAGREWDRVRRSAASQLASPHVSVYVCCFCESDDLLSQWRGYGSDHGYALGFDTLALEAATGQIPRSTLSPVRYGMGAARDVIDRAVARLDQIGFAHPGMTAYFSAMDIRALLASIKNPSFEEEREWRIIVAREVSDADNEVRFRPSAIAIIPYLAIQFPLDALVSIRVGPGNNTEVRSAGVERLIRSVGSRASVERSAIPLRS